MFKKFLSVSLAIVVALVCAMPVLADAPVTVSAQITVEPNEAAYVVGHRAMATAAAEGVTKFQWKSSSPKIASISQNGAIMFKKPGSVTITATAKGSVKAEGSVTITVLANENKTESSRVYLKGNFVYADVLVLNEAAKPLKKLGKTVIVLTGLEGHESFTASKGTAKKAIKPAQAGFVTFKLMKIDKTAVNLTQAIAAIQPAA